MTVGQLADFTAITPENMREAMQQAIEIEIATIPVYLCTYYSIDRTPDQDAIQTELQGRLVANGVPADQAAALALDLSARIMVVANKFGALFVSVVIEEMLHMALSSNVKQAIVGMPELVGKSPSEWPAYLPGHEPPFPINRAKLSLDQLYTCLQIESPKPLVAPDAVPGAIPYVTIGEFYAQIETGIATYYQRDDQYDPRRAQLVPGRGFYAQNNINTNYYSKEHDSRFVDAEDSGDLIHVVDMASALAALEEIVTQGEGAPGGKAFNDDGTVNCHGWDNPADYDDQREGELAHFDKFNLVYCEYAALQQHFRTVLDDPQFDVGSLFVHPFADNPVTAEYPAPVQDMSNLLNAVYSYLFVMTEACYRQDGNSQYEVFMFGIHKTMMWILGSLCETIRGSNYVGSDGATYSAAPTFENWMFDAASSPKEQIIALYNQAAGSNTGLENIGHRIHDLPDVPVEPYQANHPQQPILS